MMSTGAVMCAANLVSAQTPGTDNGGALSRTGAPTKEHSINYTVGQSTQLLVERVSTCLWGSKEWLPHPAACAPMSITVGHPVERKGSGGCIDLIAIEMVPGEIARPKAGRAIER
jgi:hypothetical protein